METVGIRELKSKLSGYLGRVRNGEMLLVTDRGKPVARIIPAGLPEEITNLMAEGRVRWSGKRFVPPRRPIKMKAGAPPLSDAISEDRF